jgi:hypothetical protein
MGNWTKESAEKEKNFSKKGKELVIHIYNTVDTIKGYGKEELIKEIIIDNKKDPN